MSYEPYPSGGTPKSVTYAVRLMYAGATVNAIGVIVALTSLGSVRNTIKADNPGYSASQVDAGVHQFIATILIGGLIGMGLWIWMAFMNKAGKSWARITGTVFFGIDTIGLAYSLGQAEGVASRIITVIVWLIGLTAVVLLWRKESTAYFRPESQQQW
jgi:hypothetical protein